MENTEKALARVHMFEEELGIAERWTHSSPKFIEAAELVRRRRYQRCLDELEGLVVSRIFELSKMNMSQTGGLAFNYVIPAITLTPSTHAGYKLRRHIAHSLQARSQAVKSALKRYNDAARAFHPPRPSLTWEEVVDYAFLSDFDLLRETRQDIRQQPWAQPTNRSIMNQWFKLKRAREEIQRLDIEIRRVVTHMRDEEQYLTAVEEELQESDPILAFHIQRYRLDQTRFFDLHHDRFATLLDLGGFSGSLTPGISTDPTLRAKIPKAHPAVRVEPARHLAPLRPASKPQDAMEVDGSDGSEREEGQVFGGSSDDESDEGVASSSEDVELLEAGLEVLRVADM